IRGDLAAAQARAWARIARPGAWWDGAQRIAIAAETRNAAVCRLCRARRAALSPSAVAGTHDSLDRPREPVVEVVHRVCTDPGRRARRQHHEGAEPRPGGGRRVLRPGDPAIPAGGGDARFYP